ncbi:uncharacterized protein G2W53_003396 [Senna tora]|uniref:Uncharacterized protein n=1 Tax=Senna tora TaxID=362788 RepID=A0A834XB71_9FABA|nr:uncharacterized protein G2W53_003396 [Senna tora]
MRSLHPAIEVFDGRNQRRMDTNPPFDLAPYCLDMLRMIEDERMPELICRTGSEVFVGVCRLIVFKARGVPAITGVGKIKPYLDSSSLSLTGCSHFYVDDTRVSDHVKSHASSVVAPVTCVLPTTLVAPAAMVISAILFLPWDVCKE